MLKKNKLTVAITSVIALIPMAAGLILWDRLPERMAVHFSVGNQADGWTGRGAAVFALPLICLAVHWALIITTSTGKRKEISPKVAALTLWIAPAISMLGGAIIYSYALGKTPDVGLIVCIFMGVLFAALGNYMPKCKQNSIVGIRTRSTLSSADNWYHTHRVAGKSFLFGGISLITAGIAGAPWLAVIIVPAAALIPTVYSYIYYRRHK